MMTTNEVTLLAHTIHRLAGGDLKEQITYLSYLKIVLTLDKRIYKLRPSPEFLALIRALEALIDRFDITADQASYLVANEQITGNAEIVDGDQTRYFEQPNTSSL